MIWRSPGISLLTPACLALMMALGLVAGCKTTFPRGWKVEDVAQQREARQKDAIEEFDAKRDQAELAAAQDRFNLGDFSASRTALKAIIARRPDHAEAKQLLAQIDGVKQTSASDDEHVDAVKTTTQAIYCEEPIDEAADLSVRGPAGAAHGGRRRPVYRIDRTRYQGGARGEVARRSVIQAVEALADVEPGQARLYYRAAAAAEPDNVDLLLAASAMALRYEQDALALELAQSAMSAQPGQAAPYRTVAAIYYRLGDYHASQQALSRAISLDKAHPLSYFLMGQALRKLGENDKADWNFQQAASLDPSYAARR